MIKVGMVVKHKTGGPTMVVEEKRHSPLWGERLMCSWWDRVSGRFVEQSFVESELEEIKNDSTS